MSVDILMATFQGENFLPEQLISILNQSYKAFTLLIRDDGSSDETRAILKLFAEKDSRIRLIENTARAPLGSKGNFAELMKDSTADYIFFSDQDDVWEANKIEIMMEKFQQLEKSRGSITPLLLHSDLVVVNEKNETINPSFWNYSQLSPQSATSFNRILIQNSVTGCAMMVNRALLLKSMPIPEEAVMHDGWMAMVASVFGQVHVLKTPLVRYRQHAKNVIGAKKFSLTNAVSKKQSRYLIQASAFLKQYKEDLSQDTINLLEAYLELPGQNYFVSRKTLFRYGFYKQGTLRNLLHLLKPYE